jgi:hypothetical protein
MPADHEAYNDRQAAGTTKMRNVECGMWNEKQGEQRLIRFQEEDKA